MIDGVQSEPPKKSMHQEDDPVPEVMFETISKASYETIRENIKAIEHEVTDVPGAKFVLKAAKILKNNKEE